MAERRHIVGIFEPPPNKRYAVSDYNVVKLIQPTGIGPVPPPTMGRNQ